jgi:dihydroorotase
VNLKRQPKRLLLRGGTIIDPLRKTQATGNVLIENGRIRAVGEEVTADDARVLDCTGLVITHGFCDLHAHFREPGREDKETLATGSRAALAGGFTRVCVMPNTDPPVDTPEAVRFIVEKAADLPVHIHPIGAVTKGQQGREIAELGAMREAGAVAFSDDGIPIANSQVMRLALEYSRMLEVPVINHAEDPQLRNDGVMNESPTATHLGLPGNPDVAESVMVHRDLELARLTGARLHIPHVSTAKAMAEIRRAKEEYPRLTVEVTPHHLYFTDERLVDFDTNLKVAPPLRREADRLALVEALKDGSVDCIATDHAPHTSEEKEATFDLAPFGMIGLESCFGAVHKVLVKEHCWSLPELIASLTVKPREIMGFPVDLFVPGTEAELVILDPERKWVFSVIDIYSRSKNTPFVGESLVGKPRFTLAKGWLAEVSGTANDRE